MIKLTVVQILHVHAGVPVPSSIQQGAGSKAEFYDLFYFFFSVFLIAQFNRVFLLL